MKMTIGLGLVLGALLSATWSVGAQTPPAKAGAGKADAVAALKQTLQQGTAKLRQYEWVETTVISLKGEEKSRKQNRCYYGADGKVQKISMDQPAKAKESQSGGRGGRMKKQVVENKVDDMKEYMEKAVALVHQYVPPSPEKIQAAQTAGRVTTNAQPGGGVNVVISQYLLAGDSLTIRLNPAAATLTGLNVATYLDKPEDVVTLVANMNTLPDGALYAAQTTFDAKAKNIRVVTTNSGHKPIAK